MTAQNSQDRTETGQTTGQTENREIQPKQVKSLPKDHADYWTSRLKKRSYVDRQGNVVQVPEWQVRLFHAGKEDWFNLNSGNKTVASAKARDIFVHLRTHGWEPALAKFKPKAEEKIGVTVGEFLTAAKNTGYLRLRTFLNYQNCLRTLVSEAFGVRDGDSKYDYRAGGNAEWVKRIDGIRMERVTPEKVRLWQQKRVRKAGNSPAALASAKRTCNTYVRCARSLFSKEILKRLKGVRLPAKLAFVGVELFESGSQKYVSKIHAEPLIAAAKTELKSADPEAFKVFLLALLAGMRKGEIDSLEWGMLDTEQNLIRLEPTEFLHLKTDDSAGAITVDPEVIRELEQFKPGSKSRFVIDSTVTWKTGKTEHIRVRKPRNDSAHAYYRCEPVFDRLNEWLRNKGVRSNKPLHEMRKEIGAVICTAHGIYAASRFLRHSDITTTARHYSEHKSRITVGLGKLLDTEVKPVIQEALR